MLSSVPPVRGRLFKRKIRDLTFQETHNFDGTVKIQPNSKGWYPLTAVSVYNQLNGATVRVYTGDGKWMQIVNGGPNFWDSGEPGHDATWFKVTYVEGRTDMFNMFAWDSGNGVFHLNDGSFDAVCGDCMVVSPYDLKHGRSWLSASICGSSDNPYQCALKVAAWDDGRESRFLHVEWDGRKCCDPNERFNNLLFCKIRPNDDWDKRKPEDKNSLYLHIIEKSPYVKAWENVNQVRCCMLDDRTFDDPNAELSVRICRDLKLRGRTGACDSYMIQYCREKREQKIKDPACNCINFLVDLDKKGLASLPVKVGCYPACQTSSDGKVYRTYDVAVSTANGVGECPSVCANTINNYVENGGAATFTDVSQDCHLSTGGGGGGSSGESSGGGSDSGATVDYTKYLVPAGTAMGVLFFAYLMYSILFSSKKHKHI